MNSMTGFGRASGPIGGQEVAVEVSAVNKRNLETTTSMPREWAGLERVIQQTIREKFARGRFHVSLRQQGSAAAELGWDDAAVDTTIERLRETSHRLGLVFELTTADVIRIVTTLQDDGVPAELETMENELRAILIPALDETATMRATEGQALTKDLADRLTFIAEARRRIEKASEGAADDYREALMQRLRQAGLELDLHDDRVLKEIAIFADRSDISEEITRLDSHIDHFRELLDATDPVGRRLEFLTQEMLREANTMGSKTPRTEVSKIVIELKNELERIREQIQNVE